MNAKRKQKKDGKSKPFKAGEQFAISNPMDPEALDKLQTRHKTYSTRPTPTGETWAEQYKKVLTEKSKSTPPSPRVTSSTDAMDTEEYSTNSNVSTFKPLTQQVNSSK